MSPLLYGFSCHLCLPSAMTGPNPAGLGTLGLSANLAKEKLLEAGFKDVCILDWGHPLNRYYLATIWGMIWECGGFFWQYFRYTFEDTFKEKNSKGYFRSQNPIVQAKTSILICGKKIISPNYGWKTATRYKCWQVCMPHDLARDTSSCTECYFWFWTRKCRNFGPSIFVVWLADGKKVINQLRKIIQNNSNKRETWRPLKKKKTI